MLLDKIALSASMFTEKDESRPYLGVVRVDADGTVWATDGAIALRLRRKPTPDSDFPIVPGLPECGDMESKTSVVLIPADVARATVKRLPKHTNMPILSNARLVCGADKNHIATTDLECPSVVSFARQDINFPDIERVFADAEKEQEPQPFSPLGLDANHLRLIADYRKLFGGYQILPIAVIASAPFSPVRFEWKDGAGNEVCILLMTCHI